MSSVAPSTLQPLVFDWLVSCGLAKTAKALAKEANVDFEASKAARQGKAGLQDVYAAWAKQQSAVAASPALTGAKRKAAPSEEAPANGKKAKPADSDSDSSSSDSDSDDEAPPAKKPAPTPVAAKKPAAKADSSDSDSSSSDEDEAPVAKKAAPTPAKKSPVTKPTPAKKAAESSSDSSDSDSDEDMPQAKPAPKAAIPPPASLTQTVPAATPAKKAAAAASSSDSSSSDSDSSDDDTPPAPKPTPAATPAKPKQENGANGAGRSSGKKTPNAPFQRVKIGDAPELPEGMRDNSFSVERAGTYGALAQAKLGVTRGKRFQHEKTKGKRGNYRGGTLDNEVRSIKFDD